LKRKRGWPFKRQSINLKEGIRFYKNSDMDLTKQLVMIKKTERGFALQKREEDDYEETNAVYFLFGNYMHLAGSTGTSRKGRF
jgi:hypothetical protein